MKGNKLLLIWGGLFILCAGLGFIPEPEGWLRWLLTAVSLAFFLPGFLLAVRGEPQQRLLVRNLSILSLGLTVGLLILNFLTAFRSEFLGNLFHGILVVVSSPMIASGQWALSLFLWACLLLAAGKKKKA